MGRASIARRILALCAVLPLVVAACGQGTTADTTAASGSTAASGEPSGDVPNPDVLVATVNDDVTSIDPAAVGGNDVGMNVILNVYDRLVAIPPDSGSPVPSLATEVPTLENGLISEDGLTYTFPLREGVVFSDGTDLTAEDVEYSWNRVIEMNLPEGQAPLFENVASFRAVDDLTFEVTLKSGRRGIPPLWSPFPRQASSAWTRSRPMAAWRRARPMSTWHRTWWEAVPTRSPPGSAATG